MNLAIVMLLLLLAALVAFFLLAPFRATGDEREGKQPGDTQLPDDGRAHVSQREREERERDELQSAREAKYREIRDAELDYRTGKLSRADYDAIDAELRAEALQILDRLGEERVEDDAGAGE